MEGSQRGGGGTTAVTISYPGNEDISMPQRNLDDLHQWGQRENVRKLIADGPKGVSEFFASLAPLYTEQQVEASA